MNIKFWCLACGLLLASNWVKCQELRTDSTKRNKGTTEVIVFSHQPSAPKAPDKSETSANIVKLGLLDWVTGYIPLYYERRVLPWLTVQLGAGITTRDFIADGMNLWVNDNAYYAQYSHRKVLVGPYVSFLPKFFVRGEALDGFFVCPEVSFKQYNFSANSVDPAASYAANEPVYLPGVYQHEYRKCVDFTSNVGWQTLYNHVSLEFMAGIGLRRFWESRVNADIYQNYYGSMANQNGTTNTKSFTWDCNVSMNVGGFF